MALANYTDLVTAINGWLNRSDMNAIAPDLIALAEAEFNRLLRTPDMEQRSTATLNGEALAVPADFLGLRSMSSQNAKFEFTAPDDLFAIPESYTGYPYYVTVTDGQFFFRPVPSDGAVEIVYFQRIPALTAGNPTNWLMTKYPDLYLFGALAQAEFYNWNDDRLPVVKARTEEIIGQITDAVSKERFGGRALRMPSRVHAVRGVIT
jgi:hypothetical protein